MTSRANMTAAAQSIAQARRKKVDAALAKQSPAPKHDHRRNSWFVANGTIEWCYMCGAFRYLNKTPEEHGKWQRPSGIGGANPIMKVKK
jgi:hypothetical protein